MIRGETITYSLRSLKKRKSRGFLTILSIFVGITSIFIFVSFGLGLYNYVNDFTTSTSADKIMITPKGNSAPGLDNTFAITDEDVRAVERTPGIKEATASYASVAEIAQGKQTKYVFIQSYDPEKPLMLEIGSMKASAGRLIQKGDQEKAVLGYNYQFKDKIFPGAYEVGDTIEIQGVKHRIVGFFNEMGNPQDDSNIYVTNDYFLELYPNTTGYSFVVARADVDQIDVTIERVEKSLRNSRNLDEGKEDFTVDSFEDLIAQFSSALNIIVGFILLIALISIVVSSVNTANTMITSVLERTKEIGTMKAVGARNSEILGIFLFESAFLGFIAGCIGVGLGYIISSSIGAVLDNLGWGFLSPSYSGLVGLISNFLSIAGINIPTFAFLSFQGDIFIYCILFATLTGALSGLWPAWRASKLITVQAIRYE